MTLDRLVIDNDYLKKINEDNVFRHIEQDVKDFAPGSVIELHPPTDSEFYSLYREYVFETACVHAILKQLKIQLYSDRDIRRLPMCFGSCFSGDKESGFYPASYKQPKE